MFTHYIYPNRIPPEISSLSRCETMLTDVRISKQIMCLCLLMAAGLGGSVEWEADHRLRACRSIPTQYRWNTQRCFAVSINVALSNPSLILPTLWLSRLISLWLTHCGCTRREPLHCGAQQGSDSHAAGSCALCASSLIDRWSCVWHLPMCVSVCFLLGDGQAAADLFQGRRKPCAPQCVSVLPGGRHGHSAHQSLWPLPKVWKAVSWRSIKCNVVTLVFNIVSMTLCCRDAKAHCGAKNLSDQIANLGALRSVRCNATGSQVSILISQVNGHKFTMHLSESSTCLYVLFN